MKSWFGTCKRSRTHALAGSVCRCVVSFWQACTGPLFSARHDALLTQWTNDRPPREDFRAPRRGSPTLDASKTSCPLTSFLRRSEHQENNFIKVNPRLCRGTPASSLNGASPIRRVGVAPRSRAFLVWTSAENSGQHLIQPHDSTGLRARRPTRRAGWICLCMLHVAQGEAEERESGRARARRTSPGRRGTPRPLPQGTINTRMAARHSERRDVACTRSFTWSARSSSLCSC
jgi:hypothetical protein